MKKIPLRTLVYLITDIEQHERIITAIIEREAGFIYEVSFGTETSNHYGFELSMEKDTLKAVS